MKDLYLTLKQTPVRDSIEIAAGKQHQAFFSPLIAVTHFKPDTGRQSPPKIINTFCGVMTEDQAIVYSQALSLAAELCRMAASTSMENAYNLYKQNDIKVN